MIDIVRSSYFLNIVNTKRGCQVSKAISGFICLNLLAGGYLVKRYDGLCVCEVSKVSGEQKQSANTLSYDVHSVRRWQLFPVWLFSFDCCLLPKVANSVNHGLKVVYVPTKGDGEVRSVKVSKEISWFKVSDHVWRPDV